jgi:hypothetical protein
VTKLQLDKKRMNGKEAKRGISKTRLKSLSVI